MDIEKPFKRQMIITRVDWQRPRKNPPPYGKKVLGVRPNEKSGELAIYVTRLEMAKPEGIPYGKLASERYAYDDYWIIQGVGVVRFDKIVLWAPLPTVPDELIF